AQAKLAGQAAANTTAAERFAATLHDTEEIVGTALLPTLNRYLNSLGSWLQRMNESGRLQQDVAKTTKFLADAIAVLRTALGPVIMAWQSLTKIVGCTKNAVYAPAAAFAAFKFVGLTNSIIALSKSVGLVGSAAEGSAVQV